MRTRNLSVLMLVGLILASCSTIKYVPVEKIQHDSTIVTKIQYDSIYVFKDRFVEKGKDTVFIHETEYKYKYKFLRDTLYQVQHDSIPYPVEVIKEVPRKRTTFDLISYICFGLVLGALIFLAIRFIKKPL